MGLNLRHKTQSPPGRAKQKFLAPGLPNLDSKTYIELPSLIGKLAPIP